MKDAALSRLVVVGALAVAVLAVALPVPGWADGGGGGDSPTQSSGKPADPEYVAAVKEIKASRYAAAIPLLKGVVTRDGNNADAHNWLGYSIRKTGDPAGSIAHYEKALAIDPKHRGAHEYIGEAYLMLDNVPKAKVHLVRLDKLCFLPCEQYTDLKKAIEAYEKSGGKVKPAMQ
jgi:tetratricopeptide (TPR) repeat protein